MGGPLRRTTARVLPTDADGRVLMLFGIDPARPDAPYWFTIGGGVDPGETLPEAACRELREEVGIEVSTARLVGPVHVGEHHYSFAGRDYVSESHFFALRIDDAVVDFSRQSAEEASSISDWGWFTPQELRDDGRIINHRLPEILRDGVAAGRGTRA